MFEGTLIALIVVLLVVVLLPVGIALFQRLRPAPPDRGGERRAPQPQPPPLGPPPPTERVPALTPDATATSMPRVAAPATPPPAAPPKPAPPPPRQQPPGPDSTRMVDLNEARGGSAPAPTEAMMWHGMLRCTSGPLEGQTFIIEEDGLYIGRDASLSRIVIDDSRVSKRHVRIVPRNGKVFAIDQGSTNGTFLVTSAGRERIKEHQLKRGETLSLADNVATFVYQI